MPPRKDPLPWLLGLLLLAGMLLTAFCSERGSRHGYGMSRPTAFGMKTLSRPAP